MKYNDNLTFTGEKKILDNEVTIPKYLILEVKKDYEGRIVIVMQKDWGFVLDKALAKQLADDIYSVLEK